jgi:hypothetical protein
VGKVFILENTSFSSAAFIVFPVVLLCVKLHMIERILLRYVYTQKAVESCMCRHRGCEIYIVELNANRNLYSEITKKMAEYEQRGRNFVILSCSDTSKLSILDTG